MKRIFCILLVLVIFVSGCATVQSIIKSTFPYTATLTIPNATKSDEVQTVTSVASSLDQIFGDNGSTDLIKDVKVGAVKLVASNPTNQNLGVFKSVKVFVVSENGGEVMVGSRTDVSENIGNSLVLDIDNSRFVDNYIKGSSLKIRMEYLLRNSLTSDVSVRVAINFSASPNPK
ncbi:MAG: hypothetical protein EOO87_21650 [Pedobacter sp.]|nr:MAG: hypothetical protein EOO87_21650 [Pedobacter sp.]